MTSLPQDHQEHLALDADSHNFGRKTTSEDGIIIKFRDLMSEYLLFGPDSELRLKLNFLFSQIVNHGQLLPELKFLDQVGVGPSLAPSRMEELKLEQIERPLSSDELMQVGAYLSVCHFFGLTDSHRSNVLMGLREGRFTYVSVDCETLLTEIPHGVSLGFFRHESACPCPGKYCLNFGLAEVKEKNPEDENLAATVISGYLKMLHVLEKNEETLLKILFTELKNKKLQLRQIFNYTYKYAQAMKDGTFKGYSPEEVMQMKRGDIPYFFQVFQEPKVFFWSSENEFREYTNAPSEPIFKIKSSFKVNPEVTKQMMGLFAQTLDQRPHQIYKSSFSDLTILYKKDVLVIPHPSGIVTTKRLDE